MESFLDWPVAQNPSEVQLGRQTNLDRNDNFGNWNNNRSINYDDHGLDDYFGYWHDNPRTYHYQANNIFDYGARCSSLGPTPFLGFGIRPRYHSQAYDLQWGAL